MIKYGLFDSVDGDRKYSAEDIGRYLHGLVSSGVYANKSGSMQVLADGGMYVHVEPGFAMLDGHYMEVTTPEQITLSPGATRPRIDAIVARLDKGRRLCEIAVLEGTPAANPASQSVKRTETVKEYMLAFVYVPALATAITQDNITDTRANKNVCGWVTGLIDQVDTSTLFAQWETAYQTAYKNFTAQTAAYLQATRQAYDNFMASLTEDLQVYAYIKEYTNAITLERDANAFYIGIPEYDPDTDVLLVNFRGLTYPTTDYQILRNVTTGTIGNSVTGHQVRLLNETRKAGDVIEFRVLKSKIGTPDMNS